MAHCVRIHSSNLSLKNFRSFFTSVGMFKVKEFQSEYEKNEAGKQDRIIHGQKFEEWRKRWHEREPDIVSKFRLFKIEGPARERQFVLYRQLPEFLDLRGWDQHMMMRREKKERQAQSFFVERNTVLGHDLAATHFLCFRGAAVKFVGSDQWIQEDPTTSESTIPTRYVEGVFVERINCKGMIHEGIRYEGLMNLDNLQALKWLSFEGNIHFDNWCLDRLCSLTLPSLEFLDISETLVNYHGLAALPKLNNLKTLRFLVISNKDKSEELEQACAILEKHNPNLLIKVNYE